MDEESLNRGIPPSLLADTESVYDDGLQLSTIGENSDLKHIRSHKLVLFLLLFHHYWSHDQICPVIFSISVILEIL